MAQKGIDHIGVCVVYFCHDGKGNVLLAQRSQNARDEAGRWDIGGGGIEFGDTVEDTLRKEVKEEYNGDVKQFDFLGFRDVQRVHDSRPTHWIALDFKVLVDPAGLRNNEPHKFDNFGWFRLESLPAPTHSQLRHFLDKYQDKLK